MKKIKKFLKIIIIAIAVIILFLIVIILSLNGFKFVIYRQFYDVKQDVCTNAGLNDDFVCQGITITDDNYIITSGYMSNKTNSRLYITNVENNESRYITLTKNNKEFKGHLGGIAYSDNKLYLANDSHIYTIDYNSLSNDIIDIGDGIKVNNEASYIFTDDEYVYVGEFNGAGEYMTDHKYLENSAICSVYSKTDLTKPIKIFTVRDLVQGFAIKNNKVYLSCSYGLSDSYIYVYDLTKSEEIEEELDGAKIYTLGELETKLKAPAMLEGLDVYDDKIISLTEAASNKYIFGKFFFANNIFSLDM